jgi:hypothetical protein
MSMRALVFVLLAGCATTRVANAPAASSPPPAPAPPPSLSQANDRYASWRDSIQKTVGVAYDSAAFAQLTDLSERIGPRVTGSTGYTKSVLWAHPQRRSTFLVGGAGDGTRVSGR